MKVKKRALTLLEVMIVIFLITLIGGVVGYNMKGALERGKVFKTEQAMRQLEDILSLEASTGDKSLQEIVDAKEVVLKESELVKDPKNLLKDGWNKEFTIDVIDDHLVITSEDYNKYLQKQDQKNKKQDESAQ